MPNFVVKTQQRQSDLIDVTSRLWLWFQSSILMLNYSLPIARRGLADGLIRQFRIESSADQFTQPPNDPARQRCPVNECELIRSKPAGNVKPHAAFRKISDHAGAHGGRFAFAELGRPIDDLSRVGAPFVRHGRSRTLERKLPAKYCRGVRVLWKILIKVFQFELSQPFAGNGELFLLLVLGHGIEAR